MGARAGINGQRSNAAIAGPPPITRFAWATHAVVIVVMGVTGAGKTTIGRALARALKWDFVDADDLHPPANVEKMSRSEPLTDADREPWLHAVRAAIASAVARGTPLIVACSALKRAYRRTLSNGLDVRFVYLKASRAALAERLTQRRGHFAGPGLLDSQLATLEEPNATEALIVDTTAPTETIVTRIRADLGV